jgi:AraC-like DNA-binding protein
VRFKSVVGVAPLRYLLNLRMQFAEQELREGSMSVSELGLSLGYATESAFSNAFKRTKGAEHSFGLHEHGRVKRP